MTITYKGRWQFESFGGMVGYFPPQQYPMEPVSPVWVSYVVYPSPAPGYSRIAAHNTRLRAEVTSGRDLDLIAWEYGVLPRAEGESDAQFRKRILIDI